VREPALLVLGEGRRHAAPRETDQQVLAQAPQRVVPAGTELAQRQLAQIRMLLPQQRAHEPLADLDVRSRPTHSPSIRIRKGGLRCGATGRAALLRGLASWWPLISPPEEYQEEAREVVRVINSAAIPVREVLALGSGGGNNAVHLKASFAMTLVDLSTQMLAVSRRLKPDCDHLQGDMRTVRLGRTFDAVFIHDAVDYMTSEADLRLAITTAFAHCRPGGVAVFVPDWTAEAFAPSTDHGGTDAADGRGVRYLDWVSDPDPSDTSVVTEYVFLLRDLGAPVRVVHETHRTGLFGREVWLRLLTEAGFEADSVIEETTEERTSRELFVGRRPLGSPMD